MGFVKLEDCKILDTSNKEYRNNPSYLTILDGKIWSYSKFNPAHLISHFGHPVLVEKQPIEIAFVQINGDSPTEGIVLNPRYLPKEVDYTLLKVAGYQRGRVLTLLLDTPTPEGNSLIEYKGVGANSNIPMHLSSNWYNHDSSNFISHNLADKSFKRIFGAVKTKEGASELKLASILEKEINFVNYKKNQQIPEEVISKIKDLENYKIPNLSQIIRTMDTNLRLDCDFWLPEVFNQYYSSLIEADKKIITYFFDLSEKFKMLEFQGDISENRLIDGKITDAENIGKTDFLDTKMLSLLSSILYSTYNFIPHTQRSDYNNALKIYIAPKLEKIYSSWNISKDIRDKLDKSFLSTISIPNFLESFVFLLNEEQN